MIASVDRVKHGSMENQMNGDSGNKGIARGEVPSEWQAVGLSEICCPRQHPTVPKSKFTKEGFPVYGANGQIGYFDQYTHEDRTLAITCRGATCGTINVVPPMSYITGNAMALDELKTDQVIFDYLGQALRFFGVEQSITGSAQPQITRASLKSVRLPLPSLAEQERIAEILSNVDDSIRATEAVIEQAGRVKRGLMKDLLTGGLSSEAIACGAAPEGWCTMRLGELTNIAGGTTPKRQIAEYWEDGSVSWATPTDITSMSASIYKLFDTKEKISEAAVSKGGSKIFPEQTVLMTSRATIGYVAVTQVSISTNQGFANFLPNEKYDPQFLCYLLESKRGELIQRASGSTFKEISKSSLKGIQIMLPPLSEQRRIVEILSSVDDQIVANRASADQLRRLKRGLMDDLLTGRVRTVS